MYKNGFLGMWIIVLIGLGFFIAPQAWADAADDCHELYKIKQYNDAFPLCHKAAIEGDVAAQLVLGFMYRVGKGAEKDYAKAAEWYRQAANQGVVYAQRILGKMYMDGEGVEKNYAKAAEWYIKAANQNDTLSEMMVGLMYADGIGVKKNLSYAIEFWRKLLQNHTPEYLKVWENGAELGDAAAQVILGDIYEQGISVKRDGNIAAQWYKKAADQGVEEALDIIGLRYAETYRKNEPNEKLEKCFSVARTLFKNDKWNDAVSRVEACKYQMDQDSFDDALQFIHSGLEFSGDMLYSTNWVTIPQFSKQNKIALDFRTSLIQYSKYRIEDSFLFVKFSKSDIESFKLPSPGLQKMAKFYNNWESSNFEIEHPIPTLKAQFVSSQLLRMGAVKKLLQMEILFVKEWYQRVDKEQINYLIDYQSMLGKHIGDLKHEYDFFLSHDVVSPILLRTDQLLFIADKESWVGSDDTYMAKAAKILARLDKGMILNSNVENRDQFFKVFKKFKGQVGEAKFQELKAIQDLAVSDTSNGGATRWWKGQ